jgi:ketosteroid isomerase-like protein
LSDGKDIVLALLDGIARRDASALEQLVHGDVVWWAPVSASRLGVARPLIGSGPVITLLSGAHGFFRPDTTTWSVLHLVEEDSTVVAHVRRRCMTVHGRPYDNEYLLRFDLADGRIAEAWEHTDTVYAQELIALESADG